MKRIFLALTLIACMSFPARAATTAPVGCDWQAVIERVDHQNGYMQVKLDKFFGGCTDNSGSCGHKDALIVIAVPQNDRHTYAPAQVVHVWVLGDNGSLAIPSCPAPARH